jgi:hypothetical protein
VLRRLPFQLIALQRTVIGIGGLALCISEIADHLQQNAVGSNPYRPPEATQLLLTLGTPEVGG